MKSRNFTAMSAFALLALIMALAGRPSTLAVSADPVATYEVHGVLKSLDAQSHQATIAHEAIPGYMAAMTMSYDVHDFTDLQGMQPGDSLAFHLCVTPDNAWIEHVEKTGDAASPFLAPAPPGTARELSEGDLLPDIELVDETGKKIRVSDFRGQALAITFVYSRCPLPTYCPRINQNFQTTQTLLARLEGGENWQLLSISLDPQHDTPEVLAACATNLEADARHWTFATADEATVRQFGGAVGLEFQTTGGQISHNLRTVVVDPAGRIRHIFRGNTWTPQDLASEVRSALRAPR